MAFFWLVLFYGFILVLILAALLALALGGLLGVFLGGMVGGVKGGTRAPEGGKELATYRGIAHGGCLGAAAGVAVALLLVLLAWSYLL
jgi:hypothetical protein